jgi:hypothetical protein
MDQAAAGPAATGALGAFHVTEATNVPFPLFTVDEVLPCTDADNLLAWLESTRSWESVHTHFYDQLEFLVRDSEQLTNLPEACAAILSDAMIGELGAAVAEHLGVQECDPYKVVAHKLVGGHGIGIHTDDSGKDPPLHRFVLQLGSDYDDRDGGQLGLFAAHDLEQPYRIVRPLHNTGCGFSIGPKSEHAVSDVRRGQRYTLIFTFRG